MTPEHRKIVEHIRSSGDRVRQAVAGVAPDRLARAPRPGEWSAVETLVHTRDVAVHVYGLRLRRVLAETAPAFADWDADRQQQASLARGESAQDLVDGIVAEHDQLARLLASLPEADWGRQGQHPTRGPMTLELLAGRLGAHADEHAAQIVEALRGAS